jgi:hypothetical protein
VAEVADEIVAEGVEIVWVLEQGPRLEDGTADNCMSTLDALGDPQVGWCVGDDETNPAPDAFDDSPFSIGRGFDMLVPRQTMEIVYTTSHGTPGGNENPSGQDVLEAVRAALE